MTAQIFYVAGAACIVIGLIAVVITPRPKDPNARRDPESRTAWEHEVAIYRLIFQLPGIILYALSPTARSVVMKVIGICFLLIGAACIYRGFTVSA